MNEPSRINHSSTDPILSGAQQRIRADLADLTDCLREVLHDVEPEGEALAGVLPDTDGRNGAWPADIGRPERAGQILSIWFQLLNLVEEHAAMHARRGRDDVEPSSNRGTWNTVLSQLLKQRSTGDLRGLLQRTAVCPVFTAHPTEAKRPEVLRLHRELYLLLMEWRDPRYTELERSSTRERLLAALERLWRCGEVAERKPKVEEELNEILHYLTNVLPAALARTDEHLVAAWRQAGLPMSELDDPQVWPTLTFGTWVGGDRDGHPHVTADLTRRALQRLRAEGLRVQLAALERLHDSLTLDSRRQPATAELRDMVRTMRLYLGLAPDEGDTTNPWGELAGLLVRRVRAEVIAVDAGSEGGLRDEDIARALRVLADSLHAIGADRLVRSAVRPARRSLDVFGLQLVNLDVRQNSAYHDQAVAQLLKGADRDIDWLSLDFHERQRFLQTTLGREQRWSVPRAHLGPEAQRTIDCFSVLAHHLDRHGKDGLGAIIVSMTRDLADLMTVHLIARESGLATWNGFQWRCRLMVVPLFETEEDLDNATLIMDAYRAWMGQHDVLEAMVGYSDSNKDAGYLTGQWSLHQAQERLAINGDVRIFHGRGGTPSRGAGPTHRFLESVPAEGLEAGLRLTEQGETIAQKYANLGTASHQLELLLAGVAGRLGEQRRPHFQHTRVLEELARLSGDSYRSLIAHAGFEDYWAGATPVDALAHAAIGSRPVRRTGRASLDDVRAIPWVFGWSQNRHYLTAWYGLGSALEACDDDAISELAQAEQEDHFWRYVLRNAQVSWASADMEIAQSYADLVTDHFARDSVFQLVRTEYLRTGEALARLCGADWLERRAKLHATIDLRRDALALLHHRQVDLLYRWREADSPSDPDHPLLRELLLTINALTAGLRAVG